MKAMKAMKKKAMKRPRPLRLRAFRSAIRASLNDFGVYVRWHTLCSIPAQMMVSGWFHFFGLSVGEGITVLCAHTCVAGASYPQCQVLCLPPAKLEFLLWLGSWEAIVWTLGLLSQDASTPRVWC